MWQLPFRSALRFPASRELAVGNAAGSREGDSCAKMRNVHCLSSYPPSSPCSAAASCCRYDTQAKCICDANCRTPLDAIKCLTSERVASRRNLQPVNLVAACSYYDTGFDTPNPSVDQAPLPSTSQFVACLGILHRGSASLTPAVRSSKGAQNTDCVRRFLSDPLVDLHTGCTNHGDEVECGAYRKIAFGLASNSRRRNNDTATFARHLF
jgi:hypothetical protein